MADVFVLVDHANGVVRKTTAELLTLAARVGNPVAIFVGPGVEKAQPVLARFGARKPELLELNRQAFELGRAAVAQPAPAPATA